MPLEFQAAPDDAQLHAVHGVQRVQSHAHREYPQRQRHVDPPSPPVQARHLEDVGHIAQEHQVQKAVERAVHPAGQRMQLRPVGGQYGIKAHVHIGGQDQQADDPQEDPEAAGLPDIGKDDQYDHDHTDRHHSQVPYRGIAADIEVAIHPSALPHNHIRQLLMIL